MTSILDLYEIARCERCGQHITNCVTDPTPVVCIECAPPPGLRPAQRPKSN